MSKAVRKGGLDLWVASDFHLEALPYPDRFGLRPPESFDALVVAGDVCRGDVETGVATVARLAAGKPAFLVLGNHEHWHGRMARTVQVARRACARHGVTLLDRDVARVADVTFVGATLWTDYELFHAPSAPGTPAGEPILLDDGSSAMRKDIVAAHGRDRAWLSALRRADFDGPLVVVTHHAPLPACASSLQSAPLEASDMRVEVAAIGADLWIHGHVHRRLAFPSSNTEDATMVVANAAGPHFSNAGFVEDFLVPVGR